jgi:hypothetical protein
VCKNCDCACSIGEGKNAGNNTTKGKSAESDEAPDQRTKLYCGLSFYEIRNISPIAESFTVRLRMYMHWRLDQTALEDGPVDTLLSLFIFFIFDFDFDLFPVCLRI